MSKFCRPVCSPLLRLFEKSTEYEEQTRGNPESGRGLLTGCRGTRYHFARMHGCGQAPAGLLWRTAKGVMSRERLKD